MTSAEFFVYSRPSRRENVISPSSSFRGRSVFYSREKKMSTVELNPRPVRVSPLIKFGRWSFLIAGIAYGIVNQSRLTKKENAWREVEAKRKIIRDKQMAEEKKIAQALEMKNLEEMMK